MLHQPLRQVAALGRSAGQGRLGGDKPPILPHSAILCSLIAATRPPVAPLHYFTPSPAAMTVNHSTSCTVGFPRTGERCSRAWGLLQCVPLLGKPLASGMPLPRRSA